MIVQKIRKEYHMEENTNVNQAIEELKGKDEEQLKQIIERWFDKTRMDGLRLGAQMISVVIDDAIRKSLKDGMNSSHRDFKRAINKIYEIISVQLKQHKTVQNDLMEETNNDGTAE